MSKHPGIDRKASSTQWFSQIFLLLFFQTIFFFIVALSLYAIATLNFQLLFILVIISILQNFAQRSQTFISIVKKYVKPTEYFNTFKMWKAVYTIAYEFSAFVFQWANDAAVCFWRYQFKQATQSGNGHQFIVVHIKEKFRAAIYSKKV